MAEGKRKFNDLPVVDAEETLIVKVTNHDIKAGKSNQPDSCAAARAICRDYKAAEAHVFTTRTYVRKGSKYVRYITPSAMAREIVVFDRGGKMEPGEYRLLAPRKTMKLGAGYGGKNTRGNRTGKVRPRHVTTNIRHYIQK